MVAAVGVEVVAVVVVAVIRVAMLVAVSVDVTVGDTIVVAAVSGINEETRPELQLR